MEFQTWPKVSVIIPTHNRARLLRLAITSVLDQTVQDFEIIVVDDASRDDAAEAVVRTFNDGRIRYFRHSISKGDGGTRNTGLRNAKGEYVAFLDDDDEWLPEKLEVQIQFCETSGPTFGGVHSARWTVPTKSGSQPVLTVEARNPDDFGANWVTTSSMLLRRQCVESVGLFDEQLPFGSDYDMWIRVSQEFRLGYITVPLIKYYVHGDGLTGNLAVVIQGMEAMMAKHRDFFDRHRIDHSRRNLDLGVRYFYVGDMRRSRAAFRRAIRLNPLAVRNYFNLLLSLLGPAAFKRVKALKARLRTQL